ncbi:MAG: adenylylsulfate kinase [Gammaproteobacteria bacterium]|jgi:adenylylsulfate kinase
MNRITNQNTVWHEPSVYRTDREEMNGHKSVIIWFTGLSGAGKSSLSLSVFVPDATLPITSL